MLRALNFDVDGTVINTEPSRLDGCQRVLARMGAPATRFPGRL